VAAGILAINRHHGGAIEGCMQQLGEATRREGQAPEVARHIVEEAKTAGRRLPGFGHRLHTRDPRSSRLLELARSHGVAGRAVELATALAEALSLSTGRQMPLNVDGAIAALLLDLGFTAETGNAFFLMARMPGLVAHVLEEQRREKPMRVIDPKDHGYDGPPSQGASEPHVPE
jgi:citrate synthase